MWEIRFACDTLIINVFQQHGKSEFNSGSVTWILIYIGDRRVEFSLTAVDYIEYTVMVDIIEDQLRPIGLDVGPTNLSLSSRTPATVIAISVNNVVTDDVLRVVAEGDVVGFNSFGNRDPLRI